MVVFSIFKGFFENAESDHFEMDRNNRVYFMSKQQTLMPAKFEETYTVPPSNPDISFYCQLRKQERPPVLQCFSIVSINGKLR